MLPEPPVLIFYNGTYSPMSGYVGAGETNVELRTADSTVSAKRWVDLTQVDPWPDGPLPEGTEYPRAKGMITVTDSGWNLSGSFTAPYCEWINIYCP